MTILLLLFLTVVIGGLAMLAQWARREHRAEATLVVTLLASSFMVAAAAGFVGVGLISQSASGGGPGRAFSLAAGIVAVLGGLAALALCAWRTLLLARRPTRGSSAASGEGEKEARGAWSDPPIFFALWLYVVVVSYNVVSLLAFAAAPGKVGQALSNSVALTPTTILGNQVPFALVAALGVGLFVTRDPREGLARLGYGRLRARHLAYILPFVAAALGLAYLSDRLFAFLQPDLYEIVGGISENMLDVGGLSPAAAVALAALVGLAAGMGEETLLRGALQPVFGIVATSLFFASLHVQYGPSLLLGNVFLISVGLGLLRRYINTTASFVAHALYNALVVLGAYFL